MTSYCFIGTAADICPAGYYCPVGTTEPVGCPKGTYSNKTGLQAETDCVACPAGEYCAQMAMTGTNGPCREG